MKKEKVRTASMILGVILATALVFAQYLAPGSAPDVVSTEHSEQPADTSDNAFISLATFSIPAPVSLKANLDACFLFEILLEEDRDEEYVEDDEFYSYRFFETLFRVIISPNAP